MKKRIMFFAITILMLAVVLPITLLASDDTSVTLAPWLTIVISIVSLIAGVFVPKTKSGHVMVNKDSLTMVAKAVVGVIEAKKEESDGGKKITGKEWARILASGEDGAKWLIGVLGKTPEEFKELP